jgi:hypothetical protein
MRKINEAIIHCSATPPKWWSTRTINQKVREIRRWHVEDNGWRDIGYHYIIDRDGKIATGRPLEATGAHVLGRNEYSIGICLIGGHGASENDKFEDHFTMEQNLALRGLLSDLEKQFPDIDVSGHNEYAAKGCPGFKVRPWFAYKEPRGISGSTSIQGAVAGAVTTATGALTAVGQLEGNAQIIVAGSAIVTVLLLAYIARERIKKWAKGVR